MFLAYLPAFPPLAGVASAPQLLLLIMADKAYLRDRGVVGGSQRLCPWESELSGLAWALFSVSIGKGCCLSQQGVVLLSSEEAYGGLGKPEHVTQ